MSVPIDDLVVRLPVLLPCKESLKASIVLLADSLRRAGKVLVCGNGGSAADSEHLVADLMKGFMTLRPIAAVDRSRLEELAGERGEEIACALQGSFAAIALGAGGALTTAIANDIRFDMVFAQQVYGLGQVGDVLVAMSTTGNSPSVVNAAHVARMRGMRIVAMTGRDGGEVAAIADIAIRVPADRVFEIQELHVPVYHAIALALEHEFFPDGTEASEALAPEGGLSIDQTRYPRP